MHPDGITAILRPIDREAALYLGGIELHGTEHGVQTTRSFRFDPENAVGVALQSEIDQGRCSLDKSTDVARKQAAVLLLLHSRVELGEMALDVAAAEQRVFPIIKRTHLLLG